ncbi:hypothetical protein AOZ07_02985 [Glutamicibacter halophytocola]|uniref:hypothetical protein n=1 Tax=Glutamicibacter halophytocola TaxID=1933880 RepID=UPI0006D4B535|nr:hypothetical protein [Glutamicibacter halophytocola]ALG28064.1 hypothetical protein AOZ07_02985 [Glutamicibacter halophytocola]
MTPHDGKIGPRTSEALFLFSKSDEYLAGYRLGKATGNEGRLKERESYAALRSAECLEGFFAGQKVFKYGIKKGLRKAKR